MGSITRLTPGEIAYIVTDCDALVFINTKRVSDIAGAAAEMNPAEVIRYISGCDVPARHPRDAAIATMPAIPIADEITGYSMLYSTGTTRRPKGGKRPFLDEPISTLSRSLISCAGKWRGDADWVYLSLAPLYHAAPLLFATVAAAISATSIMMERFDAEDFLSLVQEHPGDAPRHRAR
jgi:acyl-CoA synthetase (AMP-forming)/AMP-acid ligase II